MWSILVAAVVAFVFGALWFTVLFGKMWAKLMGFNTEGDPGMNGGMVKPLIANFLLNVLAASVVYYLLPQLFVLSFTEFLHVVLVLWLGFSFPIYVNQALWERKVWKLVVLNSVQGLIYFTLVSGVIFFMQ